jgi:inhibitor of KinA
MSYKISPLSEQAVTLYFDQQISEEINGKVLGMVKYIEKHPFEGLTELVPAYASMTVFYDLLRVKKACFPGQTAFGFVKLYLENLYDRTDGSIEDSGKKKIIPVHYTGEDLEVVASGTGLAIEEIIKIHSSTEYRVYMLGFLPGFAYLGGMDSRLAVPRRDTPRLSVPKGAVAIGGSQTGIYPCESPGGWHIIGYTDVQLFDYKLNSPSYLRAGDRVVFEVI